MIICIYILYYSRTYILVYLNIYNIYVYKLNIILLVVVSIFNFYFCVPPISILASCDRSYYPTHLTTPDRLHLQDLLASQRAKTCGDGFRANLKRLCWKNRVRCPGTSYRPTQKLKARFLSLPLRVIFRARNGAAWQISQSCTGCFLGNIGTLVLEWGASFFERQKVKVWSHFFLFLGPYRYKVLLQSTLVSCNKLAAYSKGESTQNKNYEADPSYAGAWGLGYIYILGRETVTQLVTIHDPTPRTDAGLAADA